MVGVNEMETIKMEEFRSNLLLLLQCGYPEGLPMNQLKAEYKQFFMEEVAPELILPRGYKNNKHWDTLFQMKEFREDFTLFYMGTAVYIKAIRKRNFTEMKLIASLAKHSHLTLVKSADFRCGCCPQDMWKQVAKETAQGPLNCSSTQQQSMMLIDGGGNQQQHNQHHNVSAGSQPHGTQSVEDIIVKIEPHQMMTNGDDDESSSSRGASTTTHHTTSDGSIYSIVQQAAHGNHHQPANNYVNGGSIDAAGSSTSNTNDGFMLGGQLPVPEGGTQPFYTFVIQNGEIKVMQIVSSGAEGASANGEALTIPSPNTTVTCQTPTAKKSLPHNKRTPPSPAAVAVKAENEIFLCSMPGCGENFVIKQHLQNHERTCSMKKYPCLFPGCDRRFKNSKQRHAHMTSRHKGTENAFRCTVPDCTAVFKTNDRLKVHESRCRFKYEQFQLMDLDALEAANNNNPSFTPSLNHSSVPNLNSSTESIEPQPTLTTEPNAAFTASLQQQQQQQAASSIISPERVIVVPNPNAQRSPSVNGNPNSNPSSSSSSSSTIQVQIPNTPEFQGISNFSTVDLSLVKSEIME
ncbi:uncharacterized protein LOC110847577 isoform X2 [Folsomia candida]|uniref:uncharacterized protein LOC110847577 isoform X2 n=1 Tax=Folsomia candida TaxID=158441 RepID=UPI001604CDFF|nr:uncharacterized protein LOC110847577 isoform X2 [Folsomia candida]